MITGTGSYVWVWKANDQGLIDWENETPLCVAGPEFNKDISKFCDTTVYIVDTVGKWFQVVEYPFVGWTTVAVTPPRGIVS